MGTIARCFHQGLKAARQHRKLPIVLWLTSLVLTLPALLPAQLWFQGKLGKRPGAVALLTDLDLSVLREMSQYDETSVWSLLGTGALAVLILGAIANAFLAGGIYATLAGDPTRAASTPTPEPDERFFARFFGSAGRYFLRSLGLLAIHAVTAGLSILVFGTLVRKAMKPLEHSLSVFRSWVHVLLPIVVAGLLCVFFGLVLDFARARLVREGQRNVFKLWWQALRFTLRRAGAAFGLWAVYGLATLAIGAAYVAVSRLVPRTSGFLIFTGFLLGQLLTYGRAQLKTILVGAELELLPPAAPPLPPEAPPLSEPPVAEPPVAAPSPAS